MVCIGGQAHSHIKLQSVWSVGGVRDGEGQQGEQAEQRIPAHPHPGICVSRAGIRWGHQSCCVDPPFWNRDSTWGGEETRMPMTDHRKD